MAGKPENLAGQTFGRLSIIGQYHPADPKDRGAWWLCYCDPKLEGCGKTFATRAKFLKSGATRSCGCLREEERLKAITKHGLYLTPEYAVWDRMKSRCYNEKDSLYQYYGARGIKMSDEWRNSFEAFYRDMGKRPSNKHSIERKDNNGPYSVSNCKWATRIEQANNTRNNIVYERNGVKKTLAEWCRELGLDYQATYMRIYKGMTFEEVIIAMKK